MDGLNSLVALAALLAWPVLPVFLVPLHYWIGYWRKVGAWFYLVAFLAWVPVAALVYLNRNFLLRYAVDVGVLSYLGVALMLFGMLLHGWASSIIGIKGTFGWYELFPGKGAFRVSGPYKLVRHPIYLAHSLLFFGVFFMTGVLSTGVVAVLDLLLSYFVVTGLEEKELEERFGREYAEYKRRVPKFMPRLRLSGKPGL